jgi:HAD superfamily hydrolase (TIGR01493 family)
MTTEIVLFDLGGVLVDLGGVDDFGMLIGEHEDDEIWRIWLTSDTVRSYERGRCSSSDFASRMVSDHSLELSADDFLHRFRNWPKGLISGAAELVESLAPHVRPACLSNTNEIHWNEQIDAPVLHALFETRFLSHEIGLVKPDREIFDHVVEGLDCEPGEILFLDDNQLNVDGARAAGLNAHRVVGVEAARSVLGEHGTLR